MLEFVMSWRIRALVSLKRCTFCLFCADVAHFRQLTQFRGKSNTLVGYYQYVCLTLLIPNLHLRLYETSFLIMHPYWIPEAVLISSSSVYRRCTQT